MTFCDVTKQNGRASVGTLYRKVLGEVVFPYDNIYIFEKRKYIMQYKLGLGRILEFTFEYLLIKCSNIRSFGVSFQVTGYLVFIHILSRFYLSKPI